MRYARTALLAATLALSPAAAFAATAPSGIAGPDANMAANATDAATMNGLAADPALNTPLVPPTLEDPEVTGPVVTPETGERSGFPWGVLGLLGLLGLIGRFRS